MKAAAGKTMRWVVLLAATAGPLALGAGAAMAAQDVLLTALKGDASVQDRAIQDRAELGDDQSLQTGEDGNCSILVDQNAVVELCGETRVSFKKTTRGNRIINIESGAVRLIVEPRDAGERIEIHTPAAIATILGTVVYVSVDPETGETKITSSESQINIRARNEEECTPRGLPPLSDVPECPEGTTIDALEQLTLMPGETHQKAQLTRQEVEALGGCLLDFHDLAADTDRIPQEGKVADRVFAVDISQVDLPPVASAAPTRDTDYTDPGDIDDPIDNPFPGNADDFSPDPRDELINCGGVPCDHGNF